MSKLQSACSQDLPRASLPRTYMWSFGHGWRMRDHPRTPLTCSFMCGTSGACEVGTHVRWSRTGSGWRIYNACMSAMQSLIAFRHPSACHGGQSPTVRCSSQVLVCASTSAGDLACIISIAQWEDSRVAGALPQWWIAPLSPPMLHHSPPHPPKLDICTEESQARTQSHLGTQ